MPENSLFYTLVADVILIYIGVKWFAPHTHKSIAYINLQQLLRK